MAAMASQQLSARQHVGGARVASRATTKAVSRVAVRVEAKESRIGKHPVQVPKGVTFSLKDNFLSVKVSRRRTCRGRVAGRVVGGARLLRRRDDGIVFFGFQPQPHFSGFEKEFGDGEGSKPTCRYTDVCRGRGEQGLEGGVRGCTFKLSEEAAET